MTQKNQRNLVLHKFQFNLFSFIIIIVEYTSYAYKLAKYRELSLIQMDNPSTSNIIISILYNPVTIWPWG